MHTPQLLSEFLSCLLGRHTQPLSGLGPLLPGASAHASTGPFPSNNLTRLEEARLLFLELLEQGSANEYRKKKEGIGHFGPLKVSFLFRPKDLLAPHHTHASHKIATAHLSLCAVSSTAVSVLV